MNPNPTLFTQKGQSKHGLKGLDGAGYPYNAAAREPGSLPLGVI